MSDFSVLFVCTGNICRSPTAEAVLLKAVGDGGLSGRVVVDSAGTHGYHIGDAPDPRTMAVAAARGVLMQDLRARILAKEDFNRFDLILAMDSGHFESMARMAPAGSRAARAMFLDYAPQAGRRDVPDPYYGSQKDFETVFELVQMGTAGLVEHIRQALALRANG